MPEAFGLRAKFRSWRRAASFFVKSSTSYRSYRNTREFPGLGMDATVNREIGGCLEYGTLSSIGQGCNIVVPKGANLKIGHKCYIGRYVELGPSGKIEIGDRTSIQDRCTLVGDVSLGRYCMLSLNVMMASGNHTFNEWPHLLIKDQEILLSTPDELARNGSRQIMVEDDCWLGVNSVILPGVTVGKGCIVGANSVVSKNLPPYVVAVGAPARIAHLRFTFVPPAAIDWLNPHDYPIFLSWFQIGQRRASSCSPFARSCRSERVCGLAGNGAYWESCSESTEHRRQRGGCQQKWRRSSFRRRLVLPYLQPIQRRITDEFLQSWR